MFLHCIKSWVYDYVIIFFVVKGMFNNYVTHRVWLGLRVFRNVV